METGEDCNWASMGQDQNFMQVAPKGSKIDIKPDGTLNIIKSNVNVSATNEEVIVPIN